MIEAEPKCIDYAQIAREAVPVLGGCYDCDKSFTGSMARDEAHWHAKTKRHMIWLECKPGDL
jgi:hypothetical protein